VALETVHRDWGICCWNCSTKGALSEVGWELAHPHWAGNEMGFEGEDVTSAFHVDLSRFLLEMALTTLPTPLCEIHHRLLTLKATSAFAPAANNTPAPAALATA
jgi:hypothetical protein